MMARPKGKRYRLITRLDLGKINKFSKKILTRDVILTFERVNHIYTRHNEDFERIISELRDTIKYPDAIYESTKDVDTLFYVRRIKNSNLNVVIRLCTEKSRVHTKNSIISSWIISEKNLVRLDKNEIIIYNKRGER